ncbi:MAG: protein kinase family protein [Saprospiraceae bacterium]|nr:protein kinase family protein [Saprospiraceae bacterium]
MNQLQDNAANALKGKQLKNGWTVTKKIEPKPGSTGGFFSVCYVVNNGEKEAFLKALNFNAFFQMFKGKSVVDIINEQTKAYQFEKELLLKCKSNRLSKVSLIIDEGEEFIDGFVIPNVPFLIFEMADGDVRSHMNFSKDIDLAWKLKSLHDVAVGLKQLHGIKIGHQDLKPSNVLLYEKGFVSKVGDLGRSLCADIVAPHDNGKDFPGEFTYAPPEYLYPFVAPDWDKRIRATDMYLFGSLVTYYFLGTNMTALIGKNLDRQFRWGVWRGSYLDVKDYLIDAFYKALKEFKGSFSNQELANELAEVLEYCCFPNPEKRGHPKAIAQIGNQYDFHRVVSKFDLLARRATYQFK